ncbi:tetratricopeptide repeat protein [uncultured Desulfuromonas sp.]|uniref:tetratricopeptide repeat protein n=1 Tax=uncultured Desulfuromonas sp. TaxID=181013 RepID=UPI002AAA92AA|nr:tetratricopeptide repeat protein [uncultured Desulfuromonas sp.]
MNPRNKLLLNSVLFISCILLAGGAILYNYGYKLCWKCSTHDYYERGKEFVTHAEDELQRTGLDFIRLAADRDDMDAQLLLAESYTSKLPQGYVSATPQAQEKLSGMVVKNSTIAKNLLSKAYNRLYAGNKMTARQWYNMALLVEAGLIQRDNQTQATLDLLTQAAEAGSYPAMTRLGAFYHQQADYARAKKWLRRAAEAGVDPQPALTLGDYFFYGKSEAVNYEKAIHWYRQALQTQRELTARGTEQERLAAEDVPMARIDMAMRQLQKSRMQPPMTLTYRLVGNANNSKIFTEDRSEGPIGTITSANGEVTAQIDPDISLALSIPVNRKTFESMSEGLDWVLQSYARSRFGSYTRFHFKLTR